MTDAVIVSTARTPIGKAHRGALNLTRGADLAAHAIRGALDRARLEPGAVEEVVLGCGYPETATGGNVARHAAPQTAGDLQPGDLEEATNAALAVGDFDTGNEQHHGTPEERREAVLAGYESGDPGVCARYVEPA